MGVKVFQSRRVVCEATLKLPMSSTTAWGQLRDFRSSAAHDPFHAGFSIEGDVVRQGASIRIEHRYLLFRTLRQGRILWWREGLGFSFSDLSIHDVRTGFPHVFSVRLITVDEKSCSLVIRVTGRWTAPGFRLVAWFWLKWVFGHTVSRTQNHLLEFALARKRAVKNPDRWRSGYP